jgi:uncharacterized protein
MADVGRPQLGVGFPFPLRPAGGELRYVGYEAKIEQSIGTILETSHRERVMLPEFGAGLRDYVFASNSPATRRKIENDIKAALIEWEPRIRTERVTALPAPDDANVLLIEIDYVVLQSSAFYNRVYPFYLTQRT